MGVHWKIQLIGGLQKTNTEGGIAQKGGAGTVCQFKGGLGKKEGVMFLRGGGGLIPQCTLWITITLKPIWKLPLGKNFDHVEASQLTFIDYQMTDFHMVEDLTKRNPLIDLQIFRIAENC